ncbi:other/NAK protein kinase [Umbelopsis sp. AD052]|nr:other/NAK protein kinase [Umbelopsis sp. AD052]
MSLLADIREAVYALTGCCFPAHPAIKVNGRTYRIIKLLGEGGFSFVYLAEDQSGRLFAMKKIRCTFGTETVDEALKEVEMYRKFPHRNIIKVLDTCTQSEPDQTKAVYIFLPFYRKGNLQDAINHHNLNNTFFSEKEMLRLFRDVCKAVKVLHTYKVTESGGRATSMSEDDENEHTDIGQEQPSQALLTNEEQQEEEPATVNVSNMETENVGELVPYAHRDIKPGNVLIADDGKTPILMDFGSVARARVNITNRQMAIAQQDLAAQQCSMPYRAPELFDVKTDSVLDEKVDVWSLGCTLYAMAYGQSPFEANMNEQGGSMALAVLNGQFKFPTDPQLERLYGQGLRDFITWMLSINPSQRPDIHQVIERAEQLMQTAREAQ